jgi:hypothetical protein
MAGLSVLTTPNRNNSGLSVCPRRRQEIHYVLRYSHSEFGALPAPIQTAILTEAKARINAKLRELGLPLVSYGYSRGDMQRLGPAPPRIKSSRTVVLGGEEYQEEKFWRTAAPAEETHYHEDDRGSS